MPLFVDTITFNINTATATNDALNIREDLNNAIVLPEYVRGQRSEPAAYARDPIVADGGNVLLDVTFTGGPAGATVPVRAQANLGASLGSVPALNVVFDGAGNAQAQFTLAPGWNAATPVSRQQITWTWEYDPAGGTNFQVFDTTQHIIYVVLDIPAAPWTQVPSTQEPWVIALDWACVFAGGATNATQATSNLTTAINGCGATYTPMTMFGWINYNLSGFLAAVAGPPFTMNCTDCADAVTTFANLVGATRIEGRFDNMVTHPILPIGGNAAVGAAWQTQNWAYHEICWAAFNANSTIWDAALRLYNAGNPLGDLPADMPFLSPAVLATDYLPRLVNTGPATLAAAGTHRPVV